MDRPNPVRSHHLDSFNNNMVFIGENEIPIGNSYRTYFFDEFVAKKTIGRLW